MEEARKALFQRAIRKYTLAEVVKHRSYGAGQRSLIELISRYPGHGVGFKVFKKTWPEGSFWHVRHVEMFVSTCHESFDFLLYAMSKEWEVRKAVGPALRKWRDCKGKGDEDPKAPLTWNVAI